jgi:hypothetical protein
MELASFRAGSGATGSLSPHQSKGFAMLSFRTRDPDRDRQTDTLRMQKLRRALMDVGTELETEKAGFQRRYEAASSDAAFSQQVFEDDRGDADISVRIDDLTHSLINYSNRIAALEQQNAFINEMLAKLDAFATELASSPDAGKASG